jgi:trk system potassium uptake protein TrkH
MGVAILPILSVGGMQLVRAESSDLSEKILPRAAQIASAIGLIYLGFTLLCAALYWWAGMTPFEAAAHAMTTIATGGFSTADASFAAFHSPTIEWIAIVFMILGALPFVLYIQASNGQIMALARDTQVRWFLGIVTVAGLAIALWLVETADTPIVTAVRHATFATVSLITGTGYASEDYGLWGPFPVALLFFLMCVGGCTGSTTGGIKIFRFSVLNAVARGQIARLIRPHGVVVTTFNRRPLPEAAAIAVMGFIFMFALSFSAFAVALSALGLDYLTAMSGALTDQYRPMSAQPSSSCCC